MKAIEQDKESLIRWGRQREHVIKLCEVYCRNSPDTAEHAEINANHLFVEIMRLESLGRERVRVYWETKEDESE